LAAFLNTTTVDQFFRQFNGHTQVNATDLRNLRYPSLDDLEALGEVASAGLEQEKLDEIAADLLPTFS
jgi:adenine-specific DNA-methyltransferase